MNTSVYRFHDNRACNRNMRLLFLAAAALSALAQDRLSINAGMLLDGRGAILKNQRILVEAGRIVSLGPASGKALLVQPRPHRL